MACPYRHAIAAHLCHSAAPAPQPVSGQRNRSRRTKGWQDVDRGAGTGIPDQVWRPAIALKVFEVVVQRVSNRIGSLALTIGGTVCLGAFLCLPERQDGVPVCLAKSSATIKAPSAVRMFSVV